MTLDKLDDMGQKMKVVVSVESMKGAAVCEKKAENG